ncbi:MAG: hypothetical protein N2258_07565 [Brevinematales bacterium]|nr:hypothetical protein [Brevinematales bacterium]
MHGFLLGFMGLVLVVGSGSLWFFFNFYKRRQFVRDLLSLPKERRFFWYKLKKSGYKVEEANKIKKFTFYLNEEEETSLLKLDFLARKDGKKWGGIFVPDIKDNRELIKLYFVYSKVFKLTGLIFYNEYDKSFVKVEV